MTRCDEIQVLLALRPEDRSVTEERRVRAHLAVCAECAARAEAYAEQDRIIRSAPRVALTPSQRNQLLSTIERKRRRQEMRSRLFTVAGTAVAITALITLVAGAKLLGPSGLQLIPGAPSHPPRENGSTASLRGVGFAVLDHEKTGCVTLESGTERCPPEDARYLWVKMSVENSEHYPTADLGPQISVVHDGQGLQETDFLPEGRSPRGACTPEGYYRDEACEFWIGAVVPDEVENADLTVRASWGDEVAVWPLGGEGEARVFSAVQFAWPTRRREISGWTFQDPRNPTHAGIDIAAEAGDPVFSIADGLVTEAGWDDERGNMAVVEHSDGWSSTYAQLDEIVVEVRQTVSQGEMVGRAGSTGESSGPHLHFELWYDGKAVNPLDHLPSQPDLRDLLLREEELPGTGLDGDDWEPETVYLHGDDWVRDLAQADGCLETLKVEGFREIEEDEAGVYIWHGVFRFEEARQAREEYKELLAGDMLDPGEILYEGAGRGRMQATALVFTGSEGEAIYWLFGVEDTVLHLLMVDSLWYEHAREIFEATMAQITGTAEATPTPEAGTGPGVEGVIDCAAVYPGLPGCLQEEPLVGGRLAFVDERAPFEGRPVVLDLEHGDARTLGEEPDQLRGWSPSGDYLLTGRGVYGTDGEVMLSLERSDSPMPVFWAPRGAFADGRDWLVRQREDGSLEARAVPEAEVRELLPAGTLGSDGRDSVILSADGQLAWTAGTDRLVEAEEWAQELYVQPVDGTGEPEVLHLSDDVRETYYRPISWVPGTRLLLAGRELFLSASLWVDGVPLVTIDVESGEITDLGVTMLLTSEAYGWHPSQPGLLALAAGGGRFINENKRLALLEVTTGELTYHTGEEEAVFAPAWSPDGTRLAYAAVPTSRGASGDGETMESTLEGRAIHVVDVSTGESRVLTEPGEAIDGWPTWSADGEQLLYTRQREGQTEVRVVAVDGSGDELLVTGLEDPMCFYGGCAWESMVAYATGE
ncbi:MAG: peptidoglycan DD-metalloendopeptidase family protein [Chloroflexota bacterium]